MKKELKITLIVLGAIIGIILLDTMQALIFNNKPIIGIETKCMIKKGLLVYHNSETKQTKFKFGIDALKCDAPVEKPNDNETANVIEPELIYIFEKTNLIEEDNTEFYDKFKIGELQNKNIKATSYYNTDDVGPGEYFIVTDDGKLYNYDGYCLLEEYNPEEEPEVVCLKEVDTPFPIDDIKYYYIFEEASIISFYSIVVYSGDMAYNLYYDYSNNDKIAFKEIDLNKYKVYEGTLTGYSDSSLSYNDITVKDKNTGNDILYKYIIYDFSLEDFNEESKSINYIISEDGYLYKVDSENVPEGDVYYLESKGKITDLKNENYFIDGSGNKAECKDYVCNITAILDNGDTYHFEE